LNAPAPPDFSTFLLLPSCLARLRRMFCHTFCTSSEVFSILGKAAICLQIWFLCCVSL
jgi:hypothetical protein